MTVRGCKWNLKLLSGFAVLILASGTGCPFNDPFSFQGPEGPAGPTGPTGATGAQGEQGEQGQPGRSPGDDLPGTVVTILDVSGTSPVEVGGPIKVSFTIEDGASNTILLDELDRFAIYVSGPSDNYAPVFASRSALLDNTITNDDGSYTYTFSDPFPSEYLAPLNDSAAYGSSDGELTGMPIAPGTYTVGIEARRDFTVDGVVVRDAGDAYFDFVIGGATLAHREVVKQSNCNVCHAQVTVHGSNRFSVTGCVLCHTDGAEDRISSDPAKATTGVSIQLANMIHQIHRGYDLPKVTATDASADPWRYEIIGFGDSVIDFSEVEFPYMPGRTGFNQQTRNCGACHEGAADGDRAYSAPSRSACSGCHNDINWTTGTRLTKTDSAVVAGTLTEDQLDDAAHRELIGGFNHTFNDSQCTLCHSPGSSLDVAASHLPPLLNPAYTNGLQVVIDSTSGNSGVGYFQPGDAITVQFRVLDGDGNPVNIADHSEVQRIRLLVSGPVGNYQNIIPGASSTTSVKNYSGTFPNGTATISCTPNSGTGPFSFTTAAIPATFPAPADDGTAYDYNGGWGELSGRPLDSGNYTLAIYADRQFTLSGTNFREASAPALAEIRIGSAGAIDGYPGHVSDAKCNACHGDLRFHGSGRKSVKLCVMCHVAGIELDDEELQGADFKIMIHKIHEETFPAMPSGAKQCSMCHATEAWKSPVERSDVNIWKVACLSCHDSNAASVHVQLNTLSVGQEACATCHGDGKEFSVEKSHKAN